MPVGVGVFVLEFDVAVEDVTVAGRCKEATVRMEARSRDDELRTEERLSCTKATSNR